MPTVSGEPEWLKKALDEARRDGRLREGSVPPPAAGPKAPRKKPGTPEADFQKAVIDFAHLHYWAVVVIRAMRTVRPNGSVRWMTPFGADGVGFPDCLFVRDRVVYAELKVKLRGLVPAQEAWRERLRRAGQEVYRWQPKDWPTIESVLT